METTCQQELQRKMAGLRNDVQVNIVLFCFVTDFLCIDKLYHAHRFFLIFCLVLNVVAHSVWNMQLYAWRSSKMSLILSIKPTRWKVRTLKASNSIFIH